MQQNIKLTDFQIDILKEVGSICSCWAITGLSQLTDKKIKLEMMPRFQIVPASGISQLIRNLSMVSKWFVGIRSRILGGVKGNILIIFSGESAFAFMNIFSSEVKDKESFTIEGISFIKEAGLIIICSFLQALSRFSDLVIFPSIPDLVNGNVEVVSNFVIKGLSRESLEVISMETVFVAEERKIKGSFLLIMEEKSIRTILEIAEKYLNYKPTI